MRTFPGIAVLLLVATLGLQAQQVQVHLKADSSQLLIGDWMGATLTVEAPANYRIIFPREDSAFVNAAYVMEDSVRMEEKQGRRVYSKPYTITVFDTGLVDIFVNVQYFKPGDTTTFTAASNAVSVDIISVRIDTAESFKDIKEVIAIPWTWWDYFLLFTGIIAVALLAWYIWHRIKTKDEKEEELPEAEPEPEIIPEELAMDRLRTLESAHLWEDGEHKKYQSDLSEIIREYIEGKFDLLALEETTPEIISQIALKGIDPKLIEELELALKCSDLTKFAKYIPDPVANRQGLKTAYMFVDETKGYTTTVEEEALNSPQPNTVNNRIIADMKMPAEEGGGDVGQ
jgi:hypothetical protein